MQSSPSGRTTRFSRRCDPRFQQIYTSNAVSSPSKDSYVLEDANTTYDMDAVTNPEVNMDSVEDKTEARQNAEPDTSDTHITYDMNSAPNIEINMDLAEDRTEAPQEAGRDVNVTQVTSDMDPVPSPEANIDLADDRTDTRQGTGPDVSDTNIAYDMDPTSNPEVSLSLVEDSPKTHQDAELDVNVRDDPFGVQVSATPVSHPELASPLDVMSDQYDQSSDDGSEYDDGPHLRDESPAMRTMDGAASCVFEPVNCTASLHQHVQPLDTRGELAQGSQPKESAEDDPVKSPEESVLVSNVTAEADSRYQISAIRMTNGPRNPSPHKSVTDKAEKRQGTPQSTHSSDRVSVRKTRSRVRFLSSHSI